MKKSAKYLFLMLIFIFLCGSVYAQERHKIMARDGRG